MKYLLFSVLMIFSACYKNYINLSIDYDAATYNNDKTEIVFVRFVRISQPAKGITAFPDGGRPKLLFKDVSLYHYKIGEDRLTPIFSFGSLPYNKTRWECQASFIKDHVAFSIRPLGGWDNKMIKNNVPDDLENKLKGIFVFNKAKNKLVKFFDFGFHPIFSPDNKYIIFLNEMNDSIQLFLTDNKTDSKVLANSDKINKSSLQWLNNSKIAFKTASNGCILNICTNEKTSIIKDSITIVKSISPKTIKMLLENVPIKNWDIKLTALSSKSESELITELIELKGSNYYRKAIIEFIEPNISSKEIQKILKRIEKHKKSLNNYDRMVYEEAMKETIHRLKTLVK